MAENDAGDKTESPTDKRRSQARADGMLGQSTELSHVVGMIAAFMAIKAISPSLWQDMITMLRGALTSRLAYEPLTIELLHHQFLGLLLLIMPEILGILLIAAIAGGGCTALQTRFLWSKKLLRPKFKQLHPVQGLKRMVSLNNVMVIIKSIAKLCIISPIAYSAFFELFPQILRLMDVPVRELLPFTAVLAGHIFWKIMTLLMILAIFDWIWQRYRTRKQMMMSKQEVKEERKSQEGDETVKRKILAIGMQRARQRMMAAVPTADVVVTNPTHIAVALKYDPELGGAPRVVAKGKGYIAERIREIARENGVPVIERKPLARALFAAVEVGKEIPYELFKTVAEILAYVYRLKGRSPIRKSTTTNRTQRS